jgi:cob(I)alamin adenosyltransferase
MARPYTRTGDAGTTGLLGPDRVPKDDVRVEAMGAVDELTAVLGMAGRVLRTKRLRDLVREIQDDLFTVGAELASPAKDSPGVPRVGPSHVQRLEKAIDELDLPKVTEFILPQGSEGFVRMHWARTVARRAERRVVALAQREAINPEILRYLNRLSSFLYAAALWIQRRERAAPRHPTYRR